LASLVKPGDRVRIRFEAAKDECVGLNGWYVDDVMVVDCPGGADCNSNGLADEIEVANGPGPMVLFRQPPSNFAYELYSDLDGPDEVWAEQFTLARRQDIHGLSIWGYY